MRIILRLLGYLKPHRLLVVLGIISMLVSQAAAAALPWILRRVLDDVLIPGKFELLTPLMLLMIGVALVRAGMLFLQRLSMESTAQKVIFDLRNTLYDHLQHLSFRFFDTAQTGQLMSRVTSDVETLRRLLGFGVVNMMSSAFMLGITLALLFRLHVGLTFLSLATLPLLVYVIYQFSTRVRPAYLKIQEQVAEMTSVLQENVTGVRVVRAFAQEESEKRKFHEVNWEFFQRQLRAIRMWAYYFPMMNFISGLGTSMVLWYGGTQVIRGNLSIGSLVAFNTYLLTLIGPLRMIGWIANLFQRAIASGERVFEILDTEPEIKEREDALDPGRFNGHVLFENVSFGYGDDASRQVLRRVSIEAAPGQTIALLGATGSGKSTIIQLIPRFYDVDEGRILIDGMDIRDMRLDSLRRQIGIVSQETFLFSASIAENIAYGTPSASREQIESAARAARIHEFIDGLERRYDTLVGERGVGLSGGQKQRVAIARAILTDPSILILDDSMSSVDTETEHMIQQAMMELLTGRTTFVIAQRLSTIKNADLIIVLEDGEIIEQGTHDELLDTSRIYRQIYDLQFRWQEEAEEQAEEGVLS